MGQGNSFFSPFRETATLPPLLAPLFSRRKKKRKNRTREALSFPFSSLLLFARDVSRVRRVWEAIYHYQGALLREKRKREKEEQKREKTRRGGVLMNTFRWLDGLTHSISFARFARYLAPPPQHLIACEEFYEGALSILGGAAPLRGRRGQRRASKMHCGKRHRRDRRGQTSSVLLLRDRRLVPPLDVDLCCRSASLSLYPLTQSKKKIQPTKTISSLRSKTANPASEVSTPSRPTSAPLRPFRAYSVHRWAQKAWTRCSSPPMETSPSPTMARPS